MQISRLFKITYILLQRETVTARELAERFEVAMRTIYRDVELLSASGIPVYMERGRGGGLRLMDNFILDKTVLTREEKAEVLASLAALTATGREEADRALKKLASLFGDSGSDWIEVDFSGWSWSTDIKDRFALLKNAVLKRRVITFFYHGTRGEGARTAEPLRLVFRGQAWYVYAYCRGREDYRFFKLSRMENVEMTTESFMRQAPPSETPADVPPAGETVFVRFVADPAAAFFVYDAYAPDAIERRADGSLLVSAAMPRGDWLLPYFLAYGRQVEILEPLWLRDEMRQTLGAMAARYCKK